MAAHAQATEGVSKEDIDEIRRAVLGADRTLWYNDLHALALVQHTSLKHVVQFTSTGSRTVFGWPDDRMRSAPMHDVLIYCNQDAKWQAVRLAMKSMTTLQKLIILDWWWHKQLRAVRCNNDTWRLQVQTSNYICALRRGGFLSTDNWIIKG